MEVYMTKYAENVDHVPPPPILLLSIIAWQFFK